MADDITFQDFRSPPGSANGSEHFKLLSHTATGNSFHRQVPRLTNLQHQVPQQLTALPSPLTFMSPHIPTAELTLDAHRHIPHDLSSGAAVPGQLEYQPAFPHTGYLGVGSQNQLPRAASWFPMAYQINQQPANDQSNTHVYQESSSPEPRGNQGAAEKPHRRGYQACQNCRSRKVKCDLGSE